MSTQHMNDVPVTIGFDNSKPAGYVVLTDEAKKVFEDMKAGGIDYVMSPTFLVDKIDDDGVIRNAKLVALSVIPAARSVKK